MRIQRSIFWIVTVWAFALGLAACQTMKEEVGTTCFQAVLESEEDTKTVLSYGGESASQVLWSLTDKIGVYMDNGTTASTFSLIQGAGTKSATFSGMGKGSSYLAVYPIKQFSSRNGSTLRVSLPTEQTFADGTFANGSFPMVAVSSTDQLPFKNLCSLVRLSIKGEETVTRIVFRPHDTSVKVSGSATVDVSTPAAPVLTMDSEACDSVVLNTGGVKLDMTTAKDFYLILPPQTYPGGFTVRVYAGDTYIEKVYNQDFTLQRSMLHRSSAFEGPLHVSRYLTFTSEGTTTLSLTNEGDNAPVLYYSTDKTTWTRWNYSELTFTTEAPLYLCGDNPDGFSFGGEKRSRFSSSGSNYSVSGDIMSLINKDEIVSVIPNDNCFISLFSDCTGLTSAPDLPATVLTKYCYSWMFSHTGLVSTPELPATTLAESCYYGMFFQCTNLTSASDLPATTLSDSCYSMMFSTCTSLTTAPKLPATKLVDRCYSYLFANCSQLSYVNCLATDISASSCVFEWLSGVSSTGIFIKASSMKSWPEGASGIPTGWTIENADVPYNNDGNEEPVEGGEIDL